MNTLQYNLNITNKIKVIKQILSKKTSQINQQSLYKLAMIKLTPFLITNILQLKANKHR